jgi:hypothetical protein
VKLRRDSPSTSDWLFSNDVTAVFLSLPYGRDLNMLTKEETVPSQRDVMSGDEAVT